MVEVGDLVEVVVVQHRAVGALVVLGTKGDPEAVHAAEEVQDYMADHYDRRPVNVVVDVGSRQVREFLRLDEDGL